MATLVPKAQRGSVTCGRTPIFWNGFRPGVHADLIDGEKFRHSPVALVHADLLNFLDRLLASYLERAGLGGRLYRKVVAVRLSTRNVFLPDLSWFTAAQVSELASREIGGFRVRRDWLNARPHPPVAECLREIG